MKTREIVLIALIILGGTLLVVYSVKRADSPKIYADRINANREEKDQFMKYSESSPFPKHERLIFTELAYFPPDLTYQVRAHLREITDKETVSISLSDGNTEFYVRYAAAEFSLNGSNHTVVLLKSKEDRSSSRLFLAFTDETSGRKTYGGGRYIDLYQQKADEITIDFNLAYNPYCVYNFQYACPLPLRENHVNTAVLAGEMNYIHDN